MPIRGVILVTVFLASLPVCFIRPFYGIAVWAVIAFLNPQWYAWDAARLMPWALGVAIPTLAGFLLFCRGWMQRIAAREVILMVVMWLWFTITSFAAGQNPLFVHHIQDTWKLWGTVSKILLMTIVTVAVVDSFARLRTLVMVISGCFGVFVVKAFPFLIATAGAYRVYGPPHSMIADNNDFGLALNMTVPLFFFLAQSEEKRWLRLLYWALFLMALPSIFFTYSRGALIGLVVVCGLMLLRSKKRLFLVPALIVGALVALLFAPAAWKERMDPTRPGALDASALSRINAWTYCWRLAKQSPITGGGFETFTPELFLRYAPNPADVHGPHSVYFGVLAEHGFIGLALYLSLVAATFLTAGSIIKEARWRGDQVAMSYGNMFRFAITGFLASGAFLGRAYFDYYFALVGCVVILKNVCQAEWAADDAAEEEAAQAQEAGEGTGAENRPADPMPLPSTLDWDIIHG